MPSSCVLCAGYRPCRWSGCWQSVKEHAALSRRPSLRADTGCVTGYAQRPVVLVVSFLSPWRLAGLAMLKMLGLRDMTEILRTRYDVVAGGPVPGIGLRSLPTQTVCKSSTTVN